jgi:hypothetical protein
VIKSLETFKLLNTIIPDANKALADAIPDAIIAVADKGKFENVVLEEAFNVSSEDHNLRPRIKHFYFTINLNCLDVKSSCWTRKAIVRRRCLVLRTVKVSNGFADTREVCPPRSMPSLECPPRVSKKYFQG